MLSAAVLLVVGPSSATPTSSDAADVASHDSSLAPNLEAQVVALVNLHRERAGCQPLQLNKHLRRAARSHSKRMARAGVMAHFLPGEPSLHRRFAQAGYDDWSLLAENVAAGFASPSDVVDAWMNSPTHRHNILNCRLRDMGVGVMANEPRYWWTQDFGRPAHTTS
ncbi:CAP domain-containing protein [Nocardioides kongjuensis]|uniref:Uncharacterized protein YkwD n=1 Tax=Nocardioides kongjuensis TaxID=349522 RepID=A0A852RH73_9ACTN|nr:CAP domain-containing protein [Nocardioides kongjuensis]NYD32727.1 uncharacterized protein YkwD [Nocardioides kongjuensis]